MASYRDDWNDDDRDVSCVQHLKKDDNKNQYSLYQNHNQDRDYQYVNSSGLNDDQLNHTIELSDDEENMEEVEEDVLVEEEEKNPQELENMIYKKFCYA